MSQPEWKADLPPIPRWDLTGIAEAARGLYFEALRPFAGATVTPTLRAEMVEATMRAGLFSTMQTSTTQVALADTLTQDLQVVLTVPIIKRMAYQLTCNLEKLQRGEPLPRFTGVVTAQWLPLEIVEVTAGIVVGGRQLMSLGLQILAGSAAGYTPRKDCPFRYLPVLARDLGYSFRRPYEQTTHLLGLRLAAWVEPSEDVTLKFDHFWVNSGMKKHNALVIKSNYPEENA